MLIEFYLFAVPGLILGLYASFRVKSAYAKWSKVDSRKGITGAEAAHAILERAGLGGMPIVPIRGHLSDHYDPMHKRLCLSEANYYGRSLAAVGVAAHEAGHALQHQAAYKPLHIRMALVPMTSFATQAAMWLFIFGMFLGFSPKFAITGVVIYGILALFQLITLPVEFDASRRAKQKLFELGIIGLDEQTGVAKVLNAAALTYVAAMVTAMLHLLYFAMLARGRQ